MDSPTLTAMQLELLKVFAMNPTEKQMLEIKQMLSEYFKKNPSGKNKLAAQAATSAAALTQRVIHLFERESITYTQAMEILGLTHPEFQQLLEAQGIKLPDDLVVLMDDLATIPSLVTSNNANGSH